MWIGRVCGGKIVKRGRFNVGSWLCHKKISVKKCRLYNPILLRFYSKAKTLEKNRSIDEKMKCMNKILKIKLFCPFFKEIANLYKLVFLFTSFLCYLFHVISRLWVWVSKLVFLPTSLYKFPQVLSTHATGRLKI